MATPTSVSNGPIRRPSPFIGANLPCKTPRANAVYITRELVSTYLITHPHLDHLSGFIINTAAFTQTGCPKRLASLPSTIEAIKTHIFNDVIWPNLSDEESGVGLVTYQRLPIAALDYVEISKGLSVQAWPISHGHCMNTHSHRGSTSEGAERSPGGSIRKVCVYDSAVYFIRDEATKKEVMMWGDVEPGLSLCWFSVRCFDTNFSSPGGSRFIVPLAEEPSRLGRGSYQIPQRITGHHLHRVQLRLLPTR